MRGTVSINFVFCLLTEIQKDVDIVWDYFEALYGKGPMDGIRGTIKNMVFKKVLSGSTVINTPKEFAEFTNTVSTISCLYLPNEDLLQEPDHVKDCTPTPNTIKTLKIVRSYTSKGVPCNKIFYLSNDEKPHFVQWYNMNEVDDNTCCHCLKSYNQNEEWLKCLVCQKWFHNECFYV